MKSYKITIELLSPLSTPLQSDTIFGHTCWIHRYLQGTDEALLRSILLEFDNNPKLIVSSGFPSGYLPRPKLRPLNTEERNELIKKYINPKKKADYLKAFQLLKKIKKKVFIPADDFEKIKEDLSEKNVVDYYLRVNSKEEVKETEEELPMETYSVSHNTINRLSWSVEEEGGGFFHSDEYHFHERRFDIYLKTSLHEFNLDYLKKVFTVMGEFGFGKDKSVGKGHFKVVEVTEISFEKKGNAVMSLSNFVPDNSLNVGWYDLLTKYGKLGGNFAKDGTRPFKNPILMITPGSTFKVNELKEYYGSCISYVHDNKNIKQHTYLFPFYVTIS